MITHLLAAIDWRQAFLPRMSIVELIVRGSVMYLMILAAFRVFRREAGSISTADLLVVVLVADAAQNAMAAGYESITEGVILVGTIIGWNYALDWLGFRYRWVAALLRAPPLLLVDRGRILRRNLRAEMITLDELREQLREHGIEDVSEVRRCFLESDGRLSVITRSGNAEAPKPKGPTG